MRNVLLLVFTVCGILVALSVVISGHATVFAGIVWPLLAVVNLWMLHFATKDWDRR